MKRDGLTLQMKKATAYAVAFSMNGAEGET